jgi:hypothetical protein
MIGGIIFPFYFLYATSSFRCRHSAGKATSLHVLALHGFDLGEW